jgi:hypothetical protein
MRVSVVATGIDDEAVVSQQTIVPAARRAGDGYGGALPPRRPQQSATPTAARSDGGTLDEPRPNFRPEEYEPAAAERKKGFNLFGWMKGQAEEQLVAPPAAASPRAPIAAREEAGPVEPPPADEDLEIPAFLRRQINPR